MLADRATRQRGAPRAIDPSEMIVLGIDPGTRLLGWGVVRRATAGRSPAARGGGEHVAHGVIATDTTAPLAERLCQIESELLEIVATHRPTEGAIEALFFAKDASAALKLGHARGVALLVMARAKLPIGEYEPTRVKRAIVGQGHAEKGQIARMIATLLGLATPPRADAADALAIAIAHLNASPIARTLAALPKGRKSYSIPRR